MKHQGEEAYEIAYDKWLESNKEDLEESLEDDLSKYIQYEDTSWIDDLRDSFSEFEHLLWKQPSLDKIMEFHDGMWIPLLKEYFKNTSNSLLYKSISKSKILTSVILFILAPWLIEVLLSSEFTDSIFVIRILSVSLTFTMLFYCYGTCYLIIHKKEKIQRRITVYVSLFGFALSWWLIKEYSFIGAALTISICRILLGIITFIMAKRTKID